ncbi:MAG: glycosyltransferase family 9 protein [Deltaproteobacteria bacterium]|nr:glycosyltransferase family 9 protein [Deltaproteobacteria bacterium]
MPKIEAKRICLVRTSALGDTVHALALANAIKRGYPEASLTWILQDLPHDMVCRQPAIDRFITFDRNADLKTWRKFLFRLRKEAPYDLAIIPQASAKVSLIAMFLPAKVKLGFNFSRAREFHWLMTNAHIPARPMQHVQDQFFEFSDFLGIEKEPVCWDFCFTDMERKWQNDFFTAIKKPAVGFVIASSSIEKDWPTASFARVMDHVANLGYAPVIIGGPGRSEAEIAERISGLCRHAPILALEKPIRHTMLQLAGCSLVVAPDTGPLHMAVALNVPTIGMYGYSNPGRCGPYRRFHDLLIDFYNEPEKEDAPITRKTRPGRMRMITPEMVIDKIEYGLEKYGTTPHDRN